MCEMSSSRSIAVRAVHHDERDVYLVVDVFSRQSAICSAPYVCLLLEILCWCLVNISLVKMQPASLSKTVQMHPVPTAEGCICAAATASDSASIFAQAENQIKLQYENVWRKFTSLWFCLCLKDREDRLQESSAQFHRYGLCRLVTYLRPERPTPEMCKKAGVVSVGRFGCWNTHTIPAEILLESIGSDHAGVFEDDLLFRDDQMSVARLATVWEDFKRFVVPAGFEAFKFGSHTLSGTAVAGTADNSKAMDTKLHRQSLSRVYKTESYLLHAFLWSRGGAQKLCGTSFVANAQKKGYEEDIDAWTNTAKLKVYSCYPQLVVQSGSDTSNTENGGVFDSLERIFWPKVGNYFQRKFCDEQDVVALVVIPNLVNILIFIFLLVLFGLVMFQRVRDARVHDSVKEEKETAASLPTISS